MIRAERVSKAFRDTVAVKDLSLSIPAGSIFGLLGPNGAGKTTLIRMVTQILAPDSGQLFFGDRPMVATDQRLIGYLPEERGLYRRMRVQEQIVYLLRLRGLSNREATQLAEEWLEKLGLSDRAAAKISSLSKGMQQKVQFIATVAHRPPVLILDEPFSGLDPINVGILEDLIQELREAGTTIIFSTHRMEQVEELCEHIALINHGECILSGPLQAVRERYRQPVYLVEFAAGEEPTRWPEPVADLERLPDGRFRFGVADEATKRAVMAALNAHYTLRRFEQETPRLREIFIQAVQQPTPSAQLVV